MLIPTIPAVVPRSPNSSLAPPRVITRKTSFSAALRNLALNHHWKPCTDEAVADHVAINSSSPLRPSAEFYGKEEEEGLDFWDALLNVEVPPHTQIDHLLHMELLGRPLSFLECNYMPAIAASPLFSTHSLSPLWLSTDLECPKMIILLNIPSSARDPPFDLSTSTSPTIALVSIHYVYLEPSNPMIT